MAKINNQFNFAMPKVVKEKETVFTRVERPFYIKCDVHPWMKSYVSVFNHPYFAVTDDTGHYQIDNIPPGTYEVIAWQEMSLKKNKDWLVKKTTVTITEGDTSQSFTYKKPPKKE